VSTFVCPIVEVGKIGKHPNADLLSISQLGHYPVIMKTGDFQPGDRAIYIPEEALLPIVPMFEFIWTKRLPDGTIEVEQNPPERHRVIWAKKLRGIFSMGLLIPIPDHLKHLSVGTDVQKELGIEKYEKPEPPCLGGDNDPTPGWFVKYTEIENLRRYDNILTLGEEVVLTEKIHGANSRYCYRDGKLYIGSHANTKKNDGVTDWNIVAQKLNLEERLKQHPDLIFFGEVYGRVQKGFPYDIRCGDCSFILFDIYDLDNRKYLDHSDFVEVANKVGLKMVPVLYQGPWLGIEQHEVTAEGMNMITGKHIREGFVVKPVQERWHPEIGRVILKLVGQEYLLTKHKR
jgi:RNA ligase (TIGR02306 family)